MRTAFLRALSPLAVLAVFSLGRAGAQFLPPPLSLVASPASPSPEETVVIRASTPTIDKNTALFRWTVDGAARPEFSGNGKNSISLKAGSVGSTIKVRADVLPLDKDGGSASLSITVSDLALVWFAETYVPPWYKGRALPTPTSVVSIAAIPKIIIDGREIPPENLVYRWSLDDQGNTFQGVGQEVFRVKTSDLSKSYYNISVVVEDILRRIKKEGRLILGVRKPKVLIYPVFPLGGTESRRVADLFSTSQRGLFDFVAEPFFFTVASRNNLSFRWSVGGREIAGSPENPSMLTIDTGDLDSGSLQASLTVSDPNRAVQSLTKIFTLLLE